MNQAIRNRPRLLMVTARFPPDVGGIETHVAEVAPRLVGLGFDVRVLTTDRTRKRPSRELLPGGVEVVRVPAYPEARDYYLAPGLVAGIRDWPADVLHVQGYHTLVAPLAMAVAAASGLPYVVSFHSGGHPSALRTRLRGLQRLALRPLFMRAARLIAVSRFELGLFRRELRLSARRFELIRNGSSLPEPRGRIDGNGNGEPLVVSVGRLERYKGHARLVQAWPDVLRSDPTARLRIIGTGPEERALRSLARASGAGERIEVTSLAATERQAMADALGEANLFVLLSEYEAHPVAVMEALAVGTPALVARTTGLTELVEDGLAAGIEPDASPGAIAAAVARELGRPRDRQRVRLPTWDDCAARLRDVYLDVLGR